MAELTTAQTTVEVSGLLGWTHYRFRVRALNAIGEGFTSTWQQAFIEGVSLPLGPQVLSVARREPSTLTVPVRVGEEL